MKDEMLVNEVRKKVAMLESKHETVTKDLDAARGFLAMLERESVNAAHSTGKQTHSDLVAESIVDALSRHGVMHRKDILNDLMDRGVHVGYDHNRQKQLAGLSSILSKDARFKSVTGKNGYWSLTTFIDHEIVEPKHDPSLSFLATSLSSALSPCPGEEKERTPKINPARRLAEKLEQHGSPTANGSRTSPFPE